MTAEDRRADQIADRTHPLAAIPVIVEAVLINGQGEWPAGPGDTASPDETIPPRDRKFLDRQMLLLTRLARMFTRHWSDLDSRTVPVHLGLGPARTDLTALLRWGGRVEPDAALPMIQPAGAVGLLPNTPLSWLSLAFHLHGEGAVWSGFVEAGATALIQAAALVEAGTPEALAIAVDCPDVTFVPAVLSHPAMAGDTASPRGLPPETAVALRLRSGLAKDTARPAGEWCTTLLGIVTGQAGTDADEQRDHAVRAGLLPADGKIGMIDGDRLAGLLGPVRTSLLPAGVALAAIGSFGAGLFAIDACDSWNCRRTAFVEVRHA